ncbi:MAG: hypothetical protein HY809_09190 [Nitrospirae bacterium]|nr:hypothetical protein [Nitrospirota bacterium]
MDTVLTMLRFFLSIKTYLWLTGISMLLFLLGSVVIPKNLAVFSLINDIPLLRWLSLNGEEASKTFWIYLLIAFMLILWVCTLICSIDAVIKRAGWKNAIKVLSPQVLHLAVIFVLLGHGISAVKGYKEDVSMRVEDIQSVRGYELKINDIEFYKKPGDNSTGWRVHILIDGHPHEIEIGRPAFYNGTAFFAKSAQEKKMKAVIGLVNDPGVLWEIIGAVVFVISAFGVFYARLSEETRLNNA